MRRFITYKLSLGETALIILDELATATLKTFYPHPYYHQFCTHAHRRSFYNALKRLERKHLVGVKLRGAAEGWHLTDEGGKAAGRRRMKLAQARARRWDRKWRLIIFDIPERIRRRRDFLRRELQSLGLHQLQKSVWVAPYSFPEEFFVIMGELDLGKHFRIVTAERIEDDCDLKDIFFPKV